MPAHRKGSLERYIPPRRSDVSNPNDSFEHNNSSHSPSKMKTQISFSDIKDTSFGAVDWNEEVENELENGMKSMEIKNWVEEVENQSPPKNQQSPRHNQQQQQRQQQYPGNNKQQQLHQHEPRGRGQSNNWSRGREGAHSKNSNHGDHGEWYQSLGRGRGRGLGGGEVKTMAQKTLSARHNRNNQEQGSSHRSSHEQLSPRHKKDQRGGHEHNYREQDNSRFADADIKVWAKDEDQMSQISQVSHDSRRAPADLRDRLRGRNKPLGSQQSFGSSSLQSFNQHDSRADEHWSEPRDQRSDFRDQRYSEDKSNQQRFAEPKQKPYVDERQNGHKGRDNHRNHDDRRDRNGGHQDDRNGTGKQLARPKKNTENFSPSHEAPEMRILFAPFGCQHYPREYSNRDVLIVSDLFGGAHDLTIYNNLLRELSESGVPEQQLWQSWHGDSHLIADDKRRWKEMSPTFNMVMERMAHYFQMDVKATRLNWYRDTSEWKPFHHDAAAMKPDKAKTQNFTVAVSFGVERDAAFEHAQSKTVISMPQPNGTIYTFGKDVNILWRHGILQVPPEKQTAQGRISIIAWGWIPQFNL